MNFFEQQLRALTAKDTAFKSTKPVYIGRACFINLGGSRRARLEFSTCRVADQYEALTVTILNATEGKIDQIKLLFKDFFTPSRGNCIPHIWVNYGKAEWYTSPTSSEIKSLSQAAYDYISIYT